MDQKNWVKVIDYADYFCRSWQYLYFEPRIVLYIRIVGTNNTVNKVISLLNTLTNCPFHTYTSCLYRLKVFHLVSFEAYYTNHTEKLCDGFVVPTRNVATMDQSATVTEGVCRSVNCYVHIYIVHCMINLPLNFRSRNALLNGDTSNYDWDSGYTCHQVGSGSILVQLGQPYIIDSMRYIFSYYIIYK